MSRLNPEGKKIIKLQKEYINNRENEIVAELILEKVEKDNSPALMETFLKKDEEALKKHLLRLKKYQATALDDFNETVEIIKEELEKDNIKSLVIANPKTLEIRIRRKFGMSQKDIVEYFGVEDKTKISEMLKTGGFLETFMNSRVKKVLRELANETAGIMYYEGKNEKVFLNVQISNAYRHEEFKGLFNINYDIVIPKEVDAIEVMCMVKKIIKDTVRGYKL